MQVAYSVLSTILLVNMLIAIMAKTFDDIWEQQERNHQMNLAQLALTWHAASVAPPPLSLFRLLSSVALQACGAATRAVRACSRCCFCSGAGAAAPAAFARLEDEGHGGDDMAPSGSEAWAKAHTEASLLAMVDRRRWLEPRPTHELSHSSREEKWAMIPWPTHEGSPRVSLSH